MKMAVGRLQIAICNSSTFSVGRRFVNLEGVPPYVGENSPAKATNCTAKVFIPSQSLPMNLFNEIHNFLDILMIN